MFLREFFYFDDNGENIEDDRYDPHHDTSILKRSDTRKTKLTLLQINRMRRASDQTLKDKKDDLEFIKDMYGLDSQQESPGL